jgi:pSer/pThr/pTyr-binding forkhead associated (FHA) protein
MHGIDARGGTDCHAAPAVLPKVALEITRGRARHLRREVRTRAFLIGTTPDCDLVLADPRFDGVHSYLFVEGSRVTIRHLGLGPALAVGGRPVASASLADADRVQMATYEFRVLIEWPQTATGEPASPVGQTLRPLVECDQATERLLADVEAFTAGPQLSLYLGDGETADGEAETQTDPAPPQAVWRTSQRQVI